LNDDQLRSGEKLKNRLACHYKKEKGRTGAALLGGRKVQAAQTRARFDPLDDDMRRPIKGEVFSAKNR
jgi:hypothetical protein